MAFFKSDKKTLVEEPTLGRLYVIRLVLEDGEIIHKIGLCFSPRSTDRMMEILRSWFTKYRYVPHARLRLDKETGVPRLLEKHIHEILDEWNWIPDKDVEGKTEMFKGLHESEVLDYIRNFDYSVLLKGLTTIKSVDAEYIEKQCNKANKFEELPY